VKISYLIQKARKISVNFKKIIFHIPHLPMASSNMNHAQNNPSSIFFGAFTFLPLFIKRRDLSVRDFAKNYRIP